MVILSKVDVEIVEPDEQYQDITAKTVAEGNQKGEAKFGKKQWYEERFPSEEKLRIYGAVNVDNKQDPHFASLQVVPFQWSELVPYRLLMQQEGYGGDRAYALTGNGVLKTYDGKLVFHCKKGGASPGSIHAFGGYAERHDIEDGNGIETTIIRELMEPGEASLQREHIGNVQLYGMVNGMPATIQYAVAAYYGIVDTPMNEAQFRSHIKAHGSGETLNGELYIVGVEDLKQIEQRNVHPQTRLVLPTMHKLFKLE